MTGEKVFGIGWAKTGTTTLGRCFSILGYKHMSQRLDLVPALRANDYELIREVVAAHDSFEDWPWIILYQTLYDWYPKSKFILTTRDVDRWIASYRSELARPNRRSVELDETRTWLYGLPFPDVTDGELRNRFLKHEKGVRAFFQDMPSQLLIVNWEAGDGWVQLCDFLQHPLPKRPFHHANRSKRTRIRGLRTRLQSLLSWNRK